MKPQALNATPLQYRPTFMALRLLKWNEPDVFSPTPP